MLRRFVGIFSSFFGVLIVSKNQFPKAIDNQSWVSELLTPSGMVRGVDSVDTTSLVLSLLITL